MKRRFRQLARRAGKNISESAIENKLLDTADKYTPVECLDVGAGADRDNLFSTLDINSDFSPDYLGDLRCLFAPGYIEKIMDYPSLLSIPENEIMVLKMQHVVEHIEWIYQEFLFEWAVKVLAPGGMIYVATPNLAYAVGVYVANRERQMRGKPLSYPVSEHTYLKPGVDHDMQRWVNFKFFSGCSPGDTHHTAFDRLWLHALLKLKGFEKISIHDGATLKAIAYKPGLAQFDVDEAVFRVVNAQ